MSFKVSSKTLTRFLNVTMCPGFINIIGGKAEKSKPLFKDTKLTVKKDGLWATGSDEAESNRVYNRLLPKSDSVPEGVEIIKEGEIPIGEIATIIDAIKMSGSNLIKISYDGDLISVVGKHGGYKIPTKVDLKSQKGWEEENFLRHDLTGDVPIAYLGDVKVNYSSYIKIAEPDLLKLTAEAMKKLVKHGIIKVKLTKTHLIIYEGDKGITGDKKIKGTIVKPGLETFFKSGIANVLKNIEGKVTWFFGKHSPGWYAMIRGETDNIEQNYYFVKAMLEDSTKKTPKPKKKKKEEPKEEKVEEKTPEEAEWD